MKKIFTLLLFLIISFSSFVTPAFAHLLASDNSIGAVLHVDPNDNPIAGSQASFFFEFKDKENKFKPDNCDCTFSVIENGREIYAQPLFQDNTDASLTNASVSYTFQQKDVYQVKVVGKPISQNDFQPFTLTWNFRVDQQANDLNQNSQTEKKPSAKVIKYIIVLGVLILLIIGFFITKTIVNNKKKTLVKGGGKKNKKNNRSLYSFCWVISFCRCSCICTCSCQTCTSRCRSNANIYYECSK